MKVSREKKQENAERFIDAFVAEVRERGYDGVTLRDVARVAGMSDGAIYKHFPTKEKLLLAYYSLRMERLAAHASQLSARPGYTFAERMHALLEFQIGQCARDKDFITKTFRPTFIAAGLMWGEVAAMRKAYVGTVRGFLAGAEARGEMPALAMPAVVEEMIWCHYVAVMLYWLRDRSARHDDTTQFIDRTLNLFAVLVGGPLLPMAQELIGFLVNRHLMPLLMDLGGMKPGAAWGASAASASGGGGATAQEGPGSDAGGAHGRTDGEPDGSGAGPEGPERGAGAPRARTAAGKGKAAGRGRKGGA